MAHATLVEVDGDRAVVVRRSTADGAEGLRREGDRLASAGHPGVVALVGSGPAGDGWELRTAHAGRPLSTLGPPTVEQAAAIAASVASTLADLHQHQIVHGRVDETHVLVGAQGRVVLCGFGDGRGAARPEDDVAAVGRLLATMLAGEEVAEPIPERRWRGSRSWSGWQRRSLLLLADQACADPPTRRPTARRLAAAIADAVPEAGRLRVPVGSTSDAVSEDLEAIEHLRPRDAAGVGHPARRRGSLVAVVTAIVLLAVGLSSRATGPSSDAVPDPGVTSRATELRSTGESLPGAELAFGGNRYRVGRTGDEVLVGDWDCDGTSTAALLRPATGEVFVFTRWAEGSWLAVEPVLQVPGAAAIESQSVDGGCPTLSVRTTDGDRLPVEGAP